MAKSKEAALEKLVIRKDHVACLSCGTIEPIHPGMGTPAPAFLAAIDMVAERHRHCKSDGKERFR